jgi:hypothetical protein
MLQMFLIKTLFPKMKFAYMHNQNLETVVQYLESSNIVLSVDHNFLQRLFEIVLGLCPLFCTKKKKKLY